MISDKIAVDNVYYMKFGDGDNSYMRNNKDILQQVIEKLDSMNIALREHIAEANLPELNKRLQSLEKTTQEARALATRAIETQDKRKRTINSFLKFTPIWITAMIGLYVIFYG